MLIDGLRRAAGLLRRCPDGTRAWLKILGLSRMAVWTGGARERAGGTPSAFMTLFMVRPLLPGLLLSRSLYPAPYTCTSDT